MNDRWKHLFRPVILERGRDIFESGEIDEVEKTAEGWRGIAHGTYDYEVETYIEGEEVTGMSCTCPYAEGGNHCKHMAALLYAVSEEVINPVSVSEDLNDVLEKMNETQLRKELKEILQKDSSLKNRILQKYRSAPADMADVNRILSLLGNLSVRIGGRNEYISWEKGWEYVQAFQEILTDSVEPMIERNETMQAFAVLKGAFHILNDVDMDGSGGEHSEIASSIEEYWDRVIHLASKEERTQMYQWFRAMEKRSGDLICGDSITSALENYFDDPEYLLPMLKDMRNKLRGDQADNYMLEYDLEKYKNLLIRSGSDLSEYEKKSEFTLESSGTNSRPITLTAQDPENPPLLRAPTIKDNFILHIRGDYWVIENIRIGYGGQAIVLDNASYNIIRNVEMFSLGSQAVIMRYGSSNNLIQNCYIHGTGNNNPKYADGIDIGTPHTEQTTRTNHIADNNVIEGCVFRNIATQPIRIREYTINTCNWNYII